MKLKKLSNTEWKGNGFGTSPARWEISGYDGYTVSGSTGMWSVFTPEGKRIVSGHTRTEASETFIEVMESK